MRERRWLTSLLSLLAFACTGCTAGHAGQDAANAPSSDPPPSDARLQGLQQELDVNTDAGYFPGIVVLIRRGERTTTLVSGMARTHPPEPMTPANRFAVGSVTKTMTATLVMQLVDRHRLALEDTVASRMPGVVPHGRHITVAELLAHRSGLPDVVNDPRYSARVPLGRHLSARGVLALLRHQPLDFAPGTRGAYSNTNYVALGALIETVTGRSFAANLRAHVFTPLGMRYASLSRSELPNAPMAHGYVVGEDVTRPQLSNSLAAGGAVMRAADVARFYTALLAGDLVSHASLQAMMRRRDGPLGDYDGYGLGLAQLRTDCGTAYGHTGHIDGYIAAAWAVPERNSLVVALANNDSGPLEHVIEEALCG
jgi:D-alanyl-D-alanine carboxypeptidase